ncbi:hypothetical protein M3I53_34960 [Paraburkholderia sp. CNPSo 3272]|uniref:hypothetical protein n=1 Tax=Paraburkholderia sp. CNPSo 3272 TaxID=2940931 RepID=UPI0020B79FAB|nr:hypothetical protein [Paraburkholderia sp. CNPSo 3272]MCP3728251.1 hypothetical protein [Paraburkholderia sp. CNPSo 3272]
MTVTNDDLENSRKLNSSSHRTFRFDPAMAPARLGRFYSRMLLTGVWPSQRALAAALSVSNSHVSRCISISGLSGSILEAFGGEKYVSFRLGKELLKLTREIKSQELRKRALKVKVMELVDPNEILQVLRSGDAPARMRARLSISVDRSGKVLRIEGPDVEKLTRKLGVLRNAIENCLKDINVTGRAYGDMALEHDSSLERP